MEIRMRPTHSVQMGTLLNTACVCSAKRPWSVLYQGAEAAPVTHTSARQRRELAHAQKRAPGKFVDLSQVFILTSPFSVPKHILNIATICASTTNPTNVVGNPGTRGVVDSRIQGHGLALGLVNYGL